MALKKFCLHKGCKELVDISVGRCELHSNDIQIQRQQYNKDRPEWTKLYKTKRWRDARLRYLNQHPLCECDECKQNNRVLPATIIDHKIPHKGNYDLFWDEDNWQAMAKRCHDRKTAKEDGGFGNR